ncbi:MAG: anthranilate synthase component I family protein [Brevundimonas sp.]|uniref:anthranilate synthase component I family protein n=1 Tax=Brevundimonas sp. TaxID=1871086 RepID=UPI0027344841|nr:anthranilate synthase component I family protein [Brevundimonas sp.]MDP3379519.1 anthranilate synthase component I family protein [Brevundimonas sp.]
MIRPFAVRRERALPWCDPLEVLQIIGGRDGALGLFSGTGGRVLIAADPDAVGQIDGDAAAVMALLDDPAWVEGAVQLLAYDSGARPATGPRPSVWPDLMAARYPAWLVFETATRTLTAIGRGEDSGGAEHALDQAEGWTRVASLEGAVEGPLSTSFDAEADEAAYRAAVADVVRRIAAGELFQANIARAWTGALKPEADPLDVFLRLVRDSPAPYAAFWRLGQRALVSNSPELFLTLEPDGRIETRPIKGTRPRRTDPAQDHAEVEALLASAKDRAENLMIVDLMRNDLSRVCVPASVRVERLFHPESYANVHHLVSTVSGSLSAGQGVGQVMAATFPPGSITGAPKHQAMKVIASHEPPRGPWCGSLLLREGDGTLTASVLIRTLAFEQGNGRWHWRTQAGAGVVADSDPAAESAEVLSKISAIKQALTGI